MAEKQVRAFIPTKSQVLKYKQSVYYIRGVYLMLLSKIIKLTTDIESRRTSLYQAANQKGQNSKEVLAISKNLDKDIIELQKFLLPK